MSLQTFRGILAAAEYVRVEHARRYMVTKTKWT